MKWPGHRKSASKAGYSLVTVLVALALTSIVTVLIGQMYLARRAAMRTVTWMRSYSEFEQVLQQHLWRQMNNYIAAGVCSTQTFPTYIRATPIGSYGHVQLLALTAKVHPRAPQSQKDAAAQCPSMNIPAYSSTPKTKDKYFQYCLAVQRSDDVALSKDSFLNGLNVFVQVRAELMNVATGLPATCYDYRAAPSAGLKIYYRVFWSRYDAGSWQFFRRNGVFYGTK